MLSSVGVPARSPIVSVKLWALNCVDDLILFTNDIGTGPERLRAVTVTVWLW